MSEKGKIFILDLLAVLLAAVLLSLPDVAAYFWPTGFIFTCWTTIMVSDVAAYFWPAGFIAVVPLLLRIHNRSHVARFFIPFFAFFLYLTWVMIWVSQYGIHWMAIENLMNSISYALVFVLYFFIRDKLKTDLCFTILPMLFVIAEYFKSLGFIAFPWPYLHHGQYANLPFIQVAEFTGAWGVTFLLIWFSTAMFGIITAPRKGRALVVAIPVLATITGFYIYGYGVVQNRFPEGDVEVSIFQRNANTMDNWSWVYNEKAWQDYSGMTIHEWSEELNFQKGGFIIWPEGAVPDALDDAPLDPERGTRRELIARLAQKMGKTFVMGAQTRDERGPYNTAAVFGPDGRLLGTYRKVHIVPFGEVIPLEQVIKSWFPAYPWGSESLTDGREMKGIKTPEGRVGIVICYESFFPDLTRRIVADDCDFLFLITNTSWFGESKASHQHAHYDVFRAVENRIWLSRAATTGVSSFIDPTGKRYDETNLYEMDSRSRKIYARKCVTFYTRYGDWFPNLCLIISLVMLTISVYRRND